MLDSFVAWVEGVQVALWILGVYGVLATVAWITFLVLWLRAK